MHPPASSYLFWMLGGVPQACTPALPIVGLSEMELAHTSSPFDPFERSMDIGDVVGHSDWLLIRCDPKMSDLDHAWTLLVPIKVL